MSHRRRRPEGNGIHFKDKVDVELRDIYESNSFLQEPCSRDKPSKSSCGRVVTVDTEGDGGPEICGRSGTGPWRTSEMGRLNASSTTLEALNMCVMEEVNSAMKDKCLVCLGEHSARLERAPHSGL